METWAIVILVVGTNLCTALLALLGIKKQLKYSDKRFAKELADKRETDEHNRKWVVRSQPLLELRAALAEMAEKFEAMVDLGAQAVGGESISSKKTLEALEKTVEGWDAYFHSGKFDQALHIQYDFELKKEAKTILLDYQSAYIDLVPFLDGGGGKSENH